MSSGLSDRVWRAGFWEGLESRIPVRVARSLKGAVLASDVASCRAFIRRPAQLAVDYVKMDIEGAERAVLREHTEWAEHVSLMTVEVHEPYTVQECVTDLQQLGFTAWRNLRYRGRTGPSPVHGLRRM